MENGVHCENFIQSNDVTNENKPDNSQQLQVSSLKQFSTRFNEFTTPLNTKNMVIDSETVKHSILNQSYVDERDWSVSKDHCYARPWNWRPENNFLRPTKTLFVRRQQINKRKSINPLAPVADYDDVIDIDTVDEPTTPIYDPAKSKQLMEECERHVALAKSDDGNNDWEENVSKTNWMPNQHRIFSGVVSILNNDHLARLAYTGVHNEPIMRRTVIDKSVERLRRLLASVAWDPKLLQWLHITLIDNLNKTYLAIYLDILQTLKSKLPTFVDKMMYGPSASNRLDILNNENLFPLLKRPWDPVAPSLLQDRPKKLPTNPLIVVVPSSNVVPKRVHRWLSLLSNLATVVTIPVNLGSAGFRMTMVNYLDQMYATTRAKIQELKSDYPGRHIVLLGFNAGATLALQVAQVDPILCVVCLGFSLLTADGKRGDPEDTLLELQSPVLFVIGQCSNTSSQEEMEELRERMRVETGLIVVGAADDYLRISKKKKRLEGITQSVVDRYVVDEVGEFISGIILSPYPPHIRQSPTHVPPDNKKIKIERKRYNSNASSLDSEPPSPTPRITRPVGRPPGSKTKGKMEPKWLNQVKPPHGYSYPSRMSIAAPPVPSYISGGIKTIPPVHPKSSAASMLESVTLNPASTAKFISNVGRTIDLSKVTLVNTIQTKSSGSLGNVLLLPDGKIKAVSSANKGGKYITSKKQLIGNKPPKPVKKVSYISHQPLQTNLPPPTNLTTQDIMDLPIIFADDNQILDGGNIQTDMNPPQQPAVPPPPPPQAPKIITSAGNKFVLLNKQITSQATNNFIITPTSIRKVSPLSTMRNPKYTKIILSKRDEPKGSLMAHISNLSPEISVRKIVAEKPAPQATVSQASAMIPEAIDLENELVATAVPKPNLASSDVRNITVFNKKSPETIKTHLLAKPIALVTDTPKRSAAEAGIVEEPESKQMKLSSDEQ